jgi:hypothetical protein
LTLNSRVSRSETAAVVCPPEFVAVPMLAMLKAAIDNSYNVAVFADPGWKKSPALSKATLQALVPTPGPRLHMAGGDVRA